MPFLADQMGIELVEGHDLRIVDGKVAIAHDRGLQGDRRCCYRRVDDDFLDPLSFNPRQPAGRAGDHGCSTARAAITIANAPGTGIADDKAIYSYMPDIVEFYTGEKAILQTRADVALRRCRQPEIRARQPVPSWS